MHRGTARAFFSFIFAMKLSWLHKYNNEAKYLYIHPHYGCKIIKNSPILILFSSNFGFFIQIWASPL
jgi:hypothetical protein